MIPEDAGRDEVLLVRVRHDPGFRAVVMHGPIEDSRRDQEVFASADAVLDFVREWLRGQGAPERGRASRH